MNISEELNSDESNGVCSMYNFLSYLPIK